MVMAGGLALLAVCLIIGRVTGSMGRGALAFIPLWLIAAVVNMWIGVNRAGYSFSDETTNIPAYFRRSIGYRRMALVERLLKVGVRLSNLN
jgi:hypothetical protein